MLMNRLLCFVIMLLFTGFLTACNDKESEIINIETATVTPEPSAVTLEVNAVNDFYTIADSENDLTALFYLGTDETYKKSKALLQEKYFSNLPNKWPEDVETVEAQPWEYYLLLPKYKDTVMTVCQRNIESLENEDIPLLSEIITTSSPVLLKCNMSDIFPSVEVNIKYGDETAVCIPSISLKDGSAMGGERIYVEDVTFQTFDN